MDWTIVGSIAELIGAAAVVISLVYVGRQLRDTTRATRAQAYQALVAQLGALQLSTAQSDRMSAAFHRVLVGDAPLADFSDADAASLILTFAAQARIYEAVFKQVREGVLDDSALAMLSGLRVLRTKAWADAWKMLRDTLDPDFVAHVEGEAKLIPSVPQGSPG